MARLKVDALANAANQSITLTRIPCSGLPPQLVFNNAGIGGTREGLMEVTVESMLTRYVTNTLGPMLVTQQLKKHGLLGRGSVVVMISSLVREANPDCGAIILGATHKRCVDADGVDRGRHLQPPACAAIPLQQGRPEHA